jgi:hypothetical protein
MIKQNYKVIWESPSGSKLADVSFSAASDAGIKKQVREIAKQIGFKSSTGKVLQGGRVIMTGIESFTRD